jgi:ribosomal protein S18 acetylase RimI-like enzyme
MQPERPFSLRPLTPQDQKFLWEMLYQAIYVAPGSPPLPRSLLQQPDLAHYATGWGKPGDLGRLAVLAKSGQPIGAAWLRLFPAEDPGYGFVAATIPELSAAVVPEFRCQGIGAAMISDLIQAARSLYPAVSLSVSQGNPAQRLYEQLGFHFVKSEGDSLTLMLDFKNE